MRLSDVDISECQYPWNYDSLKVYGSDVNFRWTLHHEFVSVVHKLGHNLFHRVMTESIYHINITSMTCLRHQSHQHESHFVVQLSFCVGNVLKLLKSVDFTYKGKHHVFCARDSFIWSFCFSGRHIYAK